MKNVAEFAHRGPMNGVMKILVSVSRWCSG
jgi:hypothetical protein